MTHTKTDRYRYKLGIAGYNVYCNGQLYAVVDSAPDARYTIRSAQRRAGRQTLEPVYHHHHTQNQEALR